MVSFGVTTGPSSSSVSSLSFFRVESMCSWLFLRGGAICSAALAGLEWACRSFCLASGFFPGISCCFKSTDRKQGELVLFEG